MCKVLKTIPDSKFHKYWRLIKNRTLQHMCYQSEHKNRTLQQNFITKLYFFFLIIWPHTKLQRKSQILNSFVSFRKTYLSSNSRYWTLFLGTEVIVVDTMKSLSSYDLNYSRGNRQEMDGWDICYILYTYTCIYLQTMFTATTISLEIDKLRMCIKWK